MQKTPLTDLFNPGFGGDPPYLAGRDEALQTIVSGGSRLRNNRPSSSVIVHGPRGNGKTALLTAARRRFESELPEARILDWTPDLISDEITLCRMILPEDLSREFKEFLQRIIGLRMAGMELTLAPAQAASVFCNILVEQAKKAPLIVMIDEAHTLDLKVGRILLNAAAQTQKNEAPFQLILAGTPGLIARLNCMQATFWDRAEDLPIGLLDPESTRLALTKPFDSHGVTLEEAALAQVTEESNGYPYFVQLWGRALTWVMGGDKVIGVTHVEKAAGVVGKRKVKYYERRYDELCNQGLLEVAQAVGTLLRKQANAKLSRAALYQTIQSSLPPGASTKDAAEVCEALVDLGYVWKPFQDYQAGIPSLMDYIAKQSAPFAPSPAVQPDSADDVPSPPP